jgi:hypothetical protein
MNRFEAVLANTLQFYCAQFRVCGIGAQQIGQGHQSLVSSALVASCARKVKW